MFKEFTRCSNTGFALSILLGAAVILASAGLTAVTGNVLVLKAGLVLGLIGARLTEAIYSHNCQWSKAGIESIVLGLVGVILVVVDDFALMVMNG